MLPDGTNSAASVPSSCAARRCSASTVGSSPYTSSPTGAAAIASRIAGVGDGRGMGGRGGGRGVAAGVGGGGGGGVPRGRALGDGRFKTPPPATLAMTTVPARVYSHGFNVAGLSGPVAWE